MLRSHVAVLAAPVQGRSECFVTSTWPEGPAPMLAVGLAASQPVPVPGAHSRTIRFPDITYIRSLQPQYPMREQVPAPASASLNQWPGVCEPNAVFNSGKLGTGLHVAPDSEWRRDVSYGPVRDTLKYRPAASRNSSVDEAAIQACTICRAGIGAELCCIRCRSCSATESP